MNVPSRSNPSSRARLAARLVALCLGVVAGSAAAQLVDISSSPLYGGRQPHPNVVVTTSVEFPTVGAAYLNVGYTRTNPYVGYFDNTKCYAYYTASGGYFQPSGNADANHECSGQFSGNFMNWATMSAIDEFRYAMTGGNRDSETGPNSGTIIMRAYLPDGAVAGVPSYYAYDSNFPRLYMNNGNTGSTVNGATNVYGTFASKVTPITGQDAGTVYITSCKTQVFFSLSNGGDCNTPAGRARDLQRAHQRLRCDRRTGPHRPLPSIRRYVRRLQAGRPDADQCRLNALRGVRLPDGPQRPRLLGAVRRRVDVEPLPLRRRAASPDEVRRTDDLRPEPGAEHQSACGDQCGRHAHVESGGQRLPGIQVGLHQLHQQFRRDRRLQALRPGRRDVLRGDPLLPEPRPDPARDRGSAAAAGRGGQLPVSDDLDRSDRVDLLGELHHQPVRREHVGRRIPAGVSRCTGQRLSPRRASRGRRSRRVFMGAAHRVARVDDDVAHHGRRAPEPVQHPRHLYRRRNRVVPRGGRRLLGERQRHPHRPGRQADDQDDLGRRRRGVDRHPRSSALPDGQVRRLLQHDRPADGRVPQSVLRRGSDQPDQPDPHELGMAGLDRRARPTTCSRRVRRS